MERGVGPGDEVSLFFVCFYPVQGDQQTKELRAMADASVQNPREAAGFFSLLTFSWINNVLKLGNKRPLEEKHLLPLEISFHAERLVGALEREWLAEERASEQNRTKPRLWKAMMRVIPYKDFITMVLLRILYSIAVNLLPLILWFFLRSIATVSENSYASAMPFVICISVISVTRSISITHGVFKAELIGIKLKVALIGVIYKKVCNNYQISVELAAGSNFQEGHDFF